MRRYIIFLAVISFSLNSFSQDVIVRKNGNRINCKITQVDSLTVYFDLKKNDSDISTSLPKTDIAVVQINTNEKELSNPIQETYEYSPGNPINPVGGRKNAWGSGIASLFIPGLGQFINGDVKAGFLFLSSNILCNYIGMKARNEDGALIAFIGSLTINIFSIVNAAHTAKKVNIARGYQLANKTYLQIQPTIIPQGNMFANKDYSYGMNFRVTF